MLQSCLVITCLFVEASDLTGLLKMIFRRGDWTSWEVSLNNGRETSEARQH